MVSVAKGLIRAASDAIEKEVKEELEEIRDHLADLNLMLSRTVTQPIESKESSKFPGMSKAYNDDDARAQVFEAHETIGASEIYKDSTKKIWI